MGCSSSKSKIDIRSFRLAPVGVYSLDRFNDKVEDVIERFGRIQDDVERKRRRLDDVSGFTWSGKGRFGDGGLKKSIYGILLQFAAVAQGDVTKIKFDVIERKPFLKISLHGLTLAEADKQIEAIMDYFDEIAECFTEKMPKIVEEMGNLAERAVTA